jgi:hypothetical protein
MVDEKRIFIGHWASASVPRGREMRWESRNTIPTITVSLQYRHIGRHRPTVQHQFPLVCEVMTMNFEVSTAVRM